jgi:hypothetical protein
VEPRVAQGAVMSGGAEGPFYKVGGGSGAVGRGRGSGSRWWRHQCRSFGSVGRGNRG